MQIWLNGWQRIGVVFTGLWLIFIISLGAVGYAEIDNGHGPFIETIKGTAYRCTAPAPAPKPHQKTITTAEFLGCAPGALVASTGDKLYFAWGRLIAAALIPILCCWLLAYALVAMIRWIVRGFRRDAA